MFTADTNTDTHTPLQKRKLTATVGRIARFVSQPGFPQMTSRNAARITREESPAIFSTTKLVGFGPCICRLSFFVIQFASFKTKKEHYIRFSFFYMPYEKRLQTNYHCLPNIKKKNGTTNRVSFRSIRTKNEMRLKRRSFSLFRFRKRAIHCCGVIRIYIRRHPPSATAANPNIVTLIMLLPVLYR